LSPPRGDGRQPHIVVVFLRGAGATARWALGETSWDATADREGFLVVIPEAMRPDPSRPPPARDPEAIRSSDVDLAWNLDVFRRFPSIESAGWRFASLLDQTGAVAASDPVVRQGPGPPAGACCRRNRAPRSAPTRPQTASAAAPPKPILGCTLTTLRQKLVKIGAKVVRHAKYLTLQLAEVAVPRKLFARLLEGIACLHPACASG
jgi:hypothetical protein